jgi:hypothetical protein
LLFGAGSVAAMATFPSVVAWGLELPGSNHRQCASGASGFSFVVATSWVVFWILSD